MLSVALAFLGWAWAYAPQPTLYLNPAWTLAWSDEFSGSALDPSKWNTCYRWGCSSRANGIHEGQWYGAGAVEVTAGRAVLKASHSQSAEGYPYSSGMLSSHGKFSFTYGFAEGRFRLPKGKGLWPAFWLMSDSGKTEVDVMEMLGQQPNKLYMVLHSFSGGQHRRQYRTQLGPDYSQGWHSFGLLWQPGLLVWYVDGREQFRTTRNVPKEPMYLIANLAVGGDWPGLPDRNTRFPASLEVDYIRVWQR
jgi:beta-glucanase (GH16 family)